MNIIEKLGIEPIVEEWLDDIDHVSKDMVRETEQQRNEMLEALIDVVKIHENRGGVNLAKAINRAKSTIKKATGKTWSEIKKLGNND